MDQNIPASALPPDLAPDPAIAADAERTARHLRLLAELGDLAMDFARDIHRTRPAANPPATEPTDTIDRTALVFAQVARCLRQTLAQEARVAQDHRARRAADAAAFRTRAERRVRHDVVAARRANPTSVPADTFRYQLEARLTDVEFDEDVAANRPIADITARICRALHIAPPDAPAADTPHATSAAQASWTFAPAPPPPIHPRPLRPETPPDG